MRVPSKKSYKKTLTIAAAIILIVTGGIYAYVVSLPQDHYYPETTGDANTQQSNDTNDTDNADKTTDNDAATTDTPGQEKEKDNPTQYEGSNPNTGNTITGVINFKAVTDGTLTLRTTIEQSLTSGTCTLTLSSNGRTVTKTANIAPNPSSSTCEGFSVPVSELGSGQWNIEISIVSDDRTGVLKDSVNI